MSDPDSPNPRATPPERDARAEPRHNASLMRSIGGFFGHIARAIKTPVEDPNAPKEVSREIEEETRTVDGKKITIRRTTIEEIEVEREDG
ncbi:MAG: hypothetical protein ACF8SC_00215 [Phycisphaerales bacterium JB037]